MQPLGQRDTGFPFQHFAGLADVGAALFRVVGRKAVDEAAHERVEKKRLEARLAVLERIVTDRGIQTAEQIDALMDRERKPEQIR